MLGVQCLSTTVRHVLCFPGARCAGTWTAHGTSLAQQETLVSLRRLAFAVGLTPCAGPACFERCDSVCHGGLLVVIMISVPSFVRFKDSTIRLVGQLWTLGVYAR
eukprot:4370251-Pyramimonas_sp.AAC.1